MTPVAVRNDPLAYSCIAELYDVYWRGISARMMPALERIFFPSLHRGDRVLDLCCGPGHLAARMCGRGFAVTGIDAAEDMIRIAKRNAPGATFLVADARRFEVPCCFEGVVSTGDSMNHMLAADDLASAFGRVYAALEPGGLFVFDMNMAQAFETQWHKSSTIAKPDHLMYVRGRYERSGRLGTTEITVFHMEGAWRRADLTMYQRCYPQREIRALLARCGFTAVRAHSAPSLGIRGRLAIGRTFFSACKTSRPPGPAPAAARED